MEFDLMAFIKDVGPTLALLGYFVWKDKQFTSRILELMGKVEAYLEQQKKAA